MKSCAKTQVEQHLQYVVTEPTRADLARMAQYPAGLLSLLDGVDTTPSLSEEVAAVMVSGLLWRALKAARPVSQVGRFVVVAYTPLAKPDPDIIITTASGGAADAFHRAVLVHQRARAQRSPASQWWYDAVMASIRGMVAPLYALRPDIMEAAFVMRWAYLNAARGRQIPGS